MNTIFNSADKFNELIFENKNKLYGAYAIRKSEKDNIAISLFLTAVFFGLLALFAISMTGRKFEMPDIIATNDVPVIPGVVIDIKPLAPEIKPPTKMPAAPKTSSGILMASDDKKVEGAKPNIDVVISKIPNLNGSDSAAKDPGIVILTTPPIAVTPPIEFAPDKMPEMDNMAQFIVNNLKYPRIALENGTKGQVYVSFVVETDGTLSEIKLKNGIGDGCEQEAKRVVEKMPLWKPGIKRGKPVRVQCTLPINFKIE